MNSAPLWFERKFDFTFPVDQYLNLHVRLWGTPTRLEEMLRTTSRDVLIEKPPGKWSAQEHTGHLADIEPLRMARVNDFLTDVDTLTVADLTNRKTDEANHNGRKLEEILAQFRTARLRLLDRLGRLQPELFTRTKLHPRLKQPMRLVDHLYFVAEHDDHHLAKIWEMTPTRWVCYAGRLPAMGQLPDRARRRQRGATWKLRLSGRCSDVDRGACRAVGLWDATRPTPPFR